MQEVLKRDLLKQLNELFYKKYQETDMAPLAYSSSEATFKINMEVAKTYNDENYIDMAQDLLNCLHGYEPTYESELAKVIFVYMTDMSSKIAMAIPESPILNEVVTIMTESSDESYIVGGFNRDSILGLKSKDIDLVTDTPYDKLKVEFLARGFGVKETGENFLVLNISKRNAEGISEVYEIANFRKDSKGSDGRRPDFVEIGNIFDDAYRRDFTANALYFRLSDITLFDPTGMATDDLRNKVLRFIGTPSERIREDYLRVWRAFRLAKTKGLTMERKTEKALRTMFEEAYNRSNPARVLQEMIKI